MAMYVIYEDINKPIDVSEYIIGTSCSTTNSHVYLRLRLGMRYYKFQA